MAADLERTKTGLVGLDKLIGGGIPKGNLVVMSGDPGSGKTCLCLQFLYEGATKFNENGVFISLEEDVEELEKFSTLFDWDFKELIAKKKIKIVNVELYDFDKLLTTIEDTVSSINAERLVIDPGVVFRLYFKTELEARKRILGLGKMLKRMNVTTVITNELSMERAKSLYGLEEYVADGVILLYHTKLENRFVRSIGILKMRGTKISEKLHPLEISKEGVKVLSEQELFEEI
ncbi:MAG: hypothetical protein HYW05_04600 [Candidatus Diapherotrites archaeon]|uniref:KaiC domain-containing protein n=1 Tax=Candidatus Iainarchaeum sp. TaxID=3101447 RepID=A0A8T4KU12_9ARCH|nr:hypothetical protein [Candidatus Diapherotrites archaeon]MBS3057424.1 hypothetical protein [Candidatus Diapherotrites archaeon]